MSPEQFEQLNNTVKETITLTVNGKIDRLKQQLDDYIEQDNTWKKDVTPSIELVKKMQGFASIGSGMLKFIILMGAVITAVWTFLRFIINHK